MKHGSRLQQRYWRSEAAYRSSKERRSCHCPFAGLCKPHKPNIFLAGHLQGTVWVPQSPHGPHIVIVSIAPQFKISLIEIKFIISNHYYCYSTASSFLSFASFLVSEGDPPISTSLVVFHGSVVGGLFPGFPRQLCGGSEDWEKWCAIGLPGG